MSALLDQAKVAFEIGPDTLEADFVNDLRSKHPEAFKAIADAPDEKKSV